MRNCIGASSKYARRQLQLGTLAVHVLHALAIWTEIIYRDVNEDKVVNHEKGHMAWNNNDLAISGTLNDHNCGNEENIPVPSDVNVLES